LLLAACFCAVPWAAQIPDAHARTLQEIKALGAISLCANPDALPYSSDQADLPGFQIEIGRAVAQRLGVSLNVDWVVPRRRVREVNCDMLLDSVNDPELHRARQLQSIPYQRTGVALALGKTADNVNGLGDFKQSQKVGVMVGSLASVILGKRGLSISPYAFQSDMLEDVEKGELTGAAISSATLSYYLKQHRGAGLRMVSAFETEPELAWTVSIGLRNADEALRAEVNKIVASLLADGAIARIYAGYAVEHHAP
jgi:ABC-type amino acid transport substrate-binding protein